MESKAHIYAYQGLSNHWRKHNTKWSKGRKIHSLLQVHILPSFHFICAPPCSVRQTHKATHKMKSSIKTKFPESFYVQAGNQIWTTWISKRPAGLWKCGLPTLHLLRVQAEVVAGDPGRISCDPLRNRTEFGSILWSLQGRAAKWAKCLLANATSYFMEYLTILWVPP